MRELFKLLQHYIIKVYVLSEQCWSHTRGKIQKNWDWNDEIILEGF